jgi:peptide deformylase
MAVLTLLHEPDIRLRKISTPVESVDRQVVRILEDMMDTMIASQGIGLAAPQVNIHKRLVVMDSGPQRLKLINPEIIWSSPDQSACQEGCLSVPGFRGTVYRSSQVKVRFLDLQSIQQELLFEGLGATCIQHEIDHLNGILFIDHLSPLKQSLFKRKLSRQRK